MIATFLIEIGLLLYVVIRYKMNPLTRLIAAILLCLAVFQFAEFNVCENNAYLGNFYSRIGFIAITLLPPLGIHLVQTIAKRGSSVIRALAWASGIGFAVVFGFSATAFESFACGGNYAVFQLSPGLGGLYFAYYYLWLFIGIGLSLRYSLTANKKIREALILQVVGYLIFILPTSIVNAVHPPSIEAIPSVMCGFAVLYAFILVLGIAPRVLSKK